MKVATSPDDVCVILSPSSDFELKLVTTWLVSKVLVERTLLALVVLRSSSVIAEVTPNDPSTEALFQTVLRAPFETASPPGIGLPTFRLPTRAGPVPASA